MERFLSAAVDLAWGPPLLVLLLGGGLGALQAAAIATGFPFAIVLVLMYVSIFIGLANEKRRK